ncbi:hypothetical protein D3C74_450740 [compost metagenome]
MSIIKISFNLLDVGRIGFGAGTHIIFDIRVHIIAVKSEQSGYVVHGYIPPIVIKQPFCPGFAVIIYRAGAKTQSQNECCDTC